MITKKSNFKKKLCIENRNIITMFEDHMNTGQLININAI